MQNYAGKVAVITGAGSGFGLEVARVAAQRGMQLVLLDVQPDALEQAKQELQPAMARVVDVANANEMQAVANDVRAQFGAPNFVFNNAGVGSGGLVWESSQFDWEWVLGVNFMGVVHGVRLFTPMMLAAEQADVNFEGHIVNTASMAGLVNAPNMGVYNASKAAVVALSETLYHDLALVSQRVHCSLLCPFYVPTGIYRSERNRPDELRESSSVTTVSQRVAQASTAQAVNKGRLSAQDVAQMVFAAMSEKQFYVFSHPQALSSVKTRMQDVLDLRNPTNPLADKPEILQALRKAINSET